MPKVRNTFVKAKTDGKESIEVIVYYFPNKGHVSAHFFVTPVDLKYILPENNLLKSKTLKNTVQGTEGKDEDEALANFRLYLDYYYEVSLKRTALIFILIPTEYVHPYEYEPREKGKTKQVKAEINFEYKVGYSIDLGNVTKYYEDGQYHNQRKDSEIYMARGKWTIVPFSEQALSRCEAIVVEVEAINKKLKNLFSNVEKVQELLLSENPKLLSHG